MMNQSTGVFAALLEVKSALLVDVGRRDDGSDVLLVRSNLTGTMQLYEFDASSELRQVTGLPEPVATASYVGNGRQVVIEVDTGGDERHQLYLVDVDASRDAPLGFADVAAVTKDPRYGHHLAGVSPDASTIAYLSNKRNGVDFDLWLYDVASGEHRCIYQKGGWCMPGSGFSPTGRWVSVLRPGPRPLDTDLLLIEVATGEVRVVAPHDDEPALVGAPAWIDATTFCVSSNVGRDYAAVVRYDATTLEATPLVGTGDVSDAEPVAGANGALVVIENFNGTSQLRLLGSGDAAKGIEIPLDEPGVVITHVIRPPKFSLDGSRLYYTLSTPRRASDVWVYDVDSAQTRRLTQSPSALSPEQMVRAEMDEVVSFDGERVPIFIYRPTTVSPHSSVVVLVHGGPESQSTLAFDPVVQGLVAAGHAVVVPNVRGSTGYGKRYASLDDTTRRLDSVRDLAAVHGALASRGFDERRAALWGGSYGGYMVLAGLAFQPDLWAAGVDIVGISDLVTFLENTSDYRRGHRELEYGSLARDRDFLAAASPLRHSDDIRAPLFVIHGRNDPRVPVGEAEQLAASLHARGLRCEVVIYDDEGHGLARLANRLDAYPRAVSFLNEVLQS